jgi:hypothetical protein
MSRFLRSHARSDRADPAVVRHSYYRTAVDAKRPRRCLRPAGQTRVAAGRAAVRARRRKRPIPFQALWGILCEGFGEFRGVHRGRHTACSSAPGATHSTLVRYGKIGGAPPVHDTLPLASESPGTAPAGNQTAQHAQRPLRTPQSTGVAMPARTASAATFGRRGRLRRRPWCGIGKGLAREIWQRTRPG